MGARVLVLAGLGLFLGAACGDECQDADGDGRGKHCEAGSDCDDSDPKFDVRCDEVARACEKGSFDPGCPCVGGRPRDCYTGRAETLGAGMCVGGQQSCVEAAWSECEGEVMPRQERCNGDDDDCDGLIDEGVLSPCGGCDLTCNGGVWGPPNVPFEGEGQLDLTSVGELTLRRYDIDSLTVWVPNTGEGTLSKIDAVSAEEVARYRVAGATPDRVAVDYLGDAWVLSPSLTGASHLTKVAAQEERCVDRDADGLLQTSRAADDLLPEGVDECVVLTTQVGAVGEVARSLSVDGVRGPDSDGGGHVWIGLQTSERLLQLDGTSANVLREVPTPGFVPHAATFDPWGTLWVVDRQGLLARVYPAFDPAEVSLIEAPLACYEFESLASDAAGVLTLTGSACEQVAFYDPARERWQQVKTPGVHDARGVAVLGGESWVAHTGGSVSRVTRDPLLIVDTLALASEGLSPLESIAVGADSRKQVWVVSSMGATGERGLVTRLDSVSGAVTAQVPIGRLPRGQGDITGDRRLGEFAPEASASYVFEGCGFERVEIDAERVSMPSEWLRLHVAATVGEGASVHIEARHAARRSELNASSWVALGSLPQDKPPYAVSFDRGGVVEARLTLRVTGRIGAPRIARVGLEWACAGPE